MKTTMLLSLILICFLPEGLLASGGPVLLNTTSGCSVYGEGKIIKYVSGDTSATVLAGRADYNFDNLMQASNGKIYCMGINLHTSPNETRAIFEYDYATSTLSAPIVLTSGGAPLFVVGNLYEATNGKLYGVSATGGPNNNGALFSYSFGANSVVLLDTFSSGAFLWSAPVQASNGRLYGTTIYDGINQGGTIYEFDTSTNTFTNVHSLPANADPQAPLLEVGADTLYGMTYSDGLNGTGTIFRYIASTGAYDTLYNFNQYGNPTGGLIRASDGKLYGTLSDIGCFHIYGTLFSFDLSSRTYTALFNSTDTVVSVLGGRPGTLLQASNGMLYGAMNGYGANGWSGSFFQYDINTGIVTPKVLLDSATTGISAGSFIEYYPWMGTGISTIPESNTKIYGKTGAISIERPDATAATVIVNDILGQQIVNITTTEPTLSLPVQSSNSIFVVQVIGASTQTVRKVFVR